MSFNKEEAERFLAEYRENQLKLDSCIGPHKFPPIVKGDRFYGMSKRVCELCHGQMRNLDIYVYEKGVQHGADAAKRTTERKDT